MLSEGPEIGEGRGRWEEICIFAKLKTFLSASLWRPAEPSVLQIFHFSNLIEGRQYEAP